MLVWRQANPKSAFQKIFDRVGKHERRARERRGDSRLANVLGVVLPEDLLERGLGHLRLVWDLRRRRCARVQGALDRLEEVLQRGAMSVLEKSSEEREQGKGGAP